MIRSYYKFMRLPEDVRKLNKIRSKKRLDCVGKSDKLDSYKGLDPFLNSKNQLCLYLNEAHNFVSTSSKRRADYTLTSSKLNFSSIYVEDLDYPTIAYGTPNANKFLSSGELNPMYSYSNDAYIFLLNKDYTQLEVLVFEDSRHLISNIYQAVIDGDFAEEVEEFRKITQPVCKYEGLTL